MQNFKELYIALEKVIDVSKLVPGITSMLVYNSKLIISWLNSNEFKETYKNHPNPPLLNPSTADYKNIPPEIAWWLNLPLPPFFDTLFLRSHGSGSSGMSAFLRKCDCEIISASSFMNAQDVYEELYSKILNAPKKHIILNIENYVVNGKCEKLYSLIPQKNAFCLVRDPISALKHYLTMKRELRGGGGIFA